MAGAFDDEQFRKVLRTESLRALSILYEEYSRHLYQLAFNLTKNHHEAMDIVQDAFMVVWDNRKKLGRSHTIPIEHYLVRVVRNKAATYFKRRKHEDIEKVIAYKDFSTDENLVESIIQKEIFEQFRSEIDSLPPRPKQTILLRIDQNLSPDQIAKKLGVSRKMVEGSYTRAIKRLKKWAGSLNGD